MAPASAGLNRKLAPLGDLAPVSEPARKITVTFSLNTTKAPPPPAVGGDGRWLGGFELTEYYPALESWFVGRPVHTPGLPWSSGAGLRYVSPPAGISFAPGPSRPLSYLRSVAVDPRLIPLGSHIFIPAYEAVNGGWFEADDTGGAIIDRHIDVFRPPPSNPSDQGNFATGQQVYIITPGRPLS